MHTFKISFRVALVVALAALAAAAQAFGLDMQALAAQHADSLGVLALAFGGNLQQIEKSLDKFESVFTQVKTQQSELADRLLLVEQRGGSPAPGEFSSKGKTLGDLFLKSFEANRELLEKTRSVRIEIKAAGDPVTTASGRTIIGAGVGTAGIAQIGMHNALNQRSTPGTSAAEYSRFTGITGGSAVQAVQGDVKSKLRPEHTLIQQTALTVAGITSLSRQALSDSAELKSCIDTVLQDDVHRQLSVALGAGAVGFVGGYNGLATAHTSVTYTSLVDAVSEAVADMQGSGFQPDVVVVGPEAWLGITTSKASDGHYLTGNGMYLAALPTEMRGLRVVISPTVPSGKALVMDSRHSELLVVDGFSIEVAYNADDFSRNLVSVLGELRVIPIYRSAGSARLITPKP